MHSPLKNTQPVPTTWRWVTREEIDDKRWNGVVHFAPNAMPYAYTWYLDAVAMEWDGLIAGDYEAVFPVPFRQKWGISYAYQPPFTQQLGMYSQQGSQVIDIEGALSLLVERFPLVEIQLNSGNAVPDHFNTKPRPNFELALNAPYEEIEAKYSGNLKRSLKKAEKFAIHTTQSISPETFTSFYLRHMRSKDVSIDSTTKHTMHRLIYKAQSYGLGSIIGAYVEDELVAANFFLSGPMRIINLMPVSSPKGKEVFAMHVIMNQCVIKNADQMKYLDFEGSAIDGVARFYKGFGAERNQYAFVQHEALSFPYRFLRKISRRK
ncbi:MAG: hypothetical protein ACPGGH_02265 [Chitinophagales bacterium]